MTGRTLRSTVGRSQEKNGYYRLKGLTLQLWDDETDPKERLLLLTPDELDQLPPGTFVNAIHWGKDREGVIRKALATEVDRDVRFGHTAWGLIIEMEE